MARVVVVGGGLGGTASAARLAKLGHEVTLVERADRLGGAVGFLERDGYRWDTGPTATALPAVLRDLFRKSGRPLERELDLVPVEPMREHRFEDGSAVALPSGSRAAQQQAIDAGLGPGLGDRWLDWTHGFADTWNLLRRDYLERPYSPDHVGKETRATLTTRTTLHRAVTRAFKDERLRALALAGTVLDGHDPRNVPAWVGMTAYVEQNFGVWTVPGGMGALAGAMTKRLGERRVDVRLGTTVEDLVVRDGRATGVVTDRGLVEADLVVCAVDPRRLPALASLVRRTMPALPRSCATSASRATCPPCRTRWSCTATRCSWSAPAAPPPRAARPGRCWGGAGSRRTSSPRSRAGAWTCASRSGSGSTCPRATSSRRTAGRRTGCSGRAGPRCGTGSAPRPRWPTCSARAPTRRPGPGCRSWGSARLSSRRPSGRPERAQPPTGARSPAKISRVALDRFSV